MAGARGSTNGSGAGTRTARGAAEGRTGAAGGRDRYATPSSSHGRAARRTLTIGEAAAALSDEFPGVTATVLRRLEAAGQFVPARSPSGYRRYSDADLDLIRIVLTNEPAAQSPDKAASWPGRPDPADLSGAEHPLTHPAAGQSAAEDAFAAVGAARDRSANGARHGGHSGSGTGTQSAAAGRGSARAARTVSSRVPAARSAVAEDLQSGQSGQSGQSAASLHAAGRRPTTEALFDVPVSGGVPQPDGTGASLARKPSGTAATTASANSTAPRNSTAQNSTTSANSTATGTATGTVPGKITADCAAADSAANCAPAATASTSAAASRRAERRWPDAEFFAPDLGEVALDRDQLAAAARTDRAWVDGLVEYGLLSGNRSAGGADLLVARAAAELAQFGMEPRHLRAVAASAARVAELIASATSPAPSRDAARRERTLLATPGRSAEAAAAAVRLHAALVRAALLRG